MHHLHLFLHLTSRSDVPLPPRSRPLSDAQPTEAETAVWNQVSAVLEEAHGILAELQSYNGAGQEIREVRSMKGLEHVIAHVKYNTSHPWTYLVFA